ncbi:MAG: ATP-binding protein [Verrucomicrobiota bacterium]
MPDDFFRAAFEQAPTGLGKISSECRWLFVNQRLSQILGYGSEELAGKPCCEFIHPDDIATVHEQFRRIIAESVPLACFESRFVCKDGSETTGLLRLTRVQSLTGEAPFVVMGLEDISEKREIALQLQHSQKMDAFGRLAGGIAHDFNNLLTIFAGYTDMLLADLGPDDPQREPLEEMQRAAERATALTSQLLAFSRRQHSSPRIINLSNVILDLRKMLRRLIGEDIEMAVNIADGLGSVHADPRQIETVLINLAVNARDAMPHGGRLSIEAGNVNIRPSDRRVAAGVAPGAYVQITVSDTGTGMDENVVTHLFEPFFTTKAAGHGTGLGLSTCYGIIKQSGGHIAVESVPGKGSTFRILLERIPNSAETGIGAASLKELPRGKGELILIVEDDPAVQKTYSAMLRQLGYQVICASNGDKALRIASQHPEIRLVITDLVMPLMSGTDLAQALRHLSPDAKVILTSGYDSEPLENSGTMAHNTFLPKPLSRDILAHKLRELLEKL